MTSPFSIPRPSLYRVSLAIRLLTGISLYFAASLPSASAEDFPIASALIDSATWAQPGFHASWIPQRTTTRIAHRIWPRPGSQRGAPLPYPRIFGVQPQVISSRFIDGDIRSITLLFLDSGTHFGYIPRGNAVQTAKDNQESFNKLYTMTESAVRAGLTQIATDRPEKITLGSESLLQQEVEIFRTGDLYARMHKIEDQLVKVTFFLDAANAHSWLAPEARDIKPRDRAPAFEKNVSASDDDVLLNEIPIFPQGDRAYCGVSALSMAMQYLGLDIDTEDYAAGAGIRYGSTRGSNIRETYEAAGDELGFDVRRQTKFNFERACKSIDAGIPVLVWRRWSQQRDYLHTQYAKRRAKDRTVKLPIVDNNERALWPDKKAYSHASVITGYNSKLGEVIFTESWGEAVRNRRMRVAEMEATCYYTFYISP